jgi:uncharacterized membrane protein required for colicin V production
VKPLSILIDIALVLIVAFFIWRGFVNGFVRGIFGILAIIVAIYGANLVAKAYSDDFTGVLEPFVSGIVDKAYREVITGDAGGEGSQNDVQTNDVQTNDETEHTPDENNLPYSSPVTEKSKGVYDVSYETLRMMGISEGAARKIAGEVSGTIDTVGQSMSTNLTGMLCSALAYIAVFAVAFILIAIIFAVIGNIFNLAFSIPGIKSIDKIIGLVLGIAKGSLIVLTLAVVIRYFGIFAPETIEKTVILKYILNMNPLASILGI